MTPTTDLVQAALDFGFSHAALLDPSTLKVREEVRLMCSADRCQMFGRSWTCPPGSGSLDESRTTIALYRSGVIVQTTRDLDDPFDYEGMMAADHDQKRRLTEFRKELSSSWPELIALGNGACTICPDCTYPTSPCRLPDLAIQSMEAFGLVVSDTCSDNGLGYYYGPGTITYTGCYLLDTAGHGVGDDRTTILPTARIEMCCDQSGRSHCTRMATGDAGIKRPRVAL